MLNLGANYTTLYMFHSTSVIKRTVYQGWREFLSGLRQYQKSGFAVLLELHPCSRHIYSPPPHLPLLVVELNTCMFISYTEMCFLCFFSLAGYAADTTLGKCVKQVPSGSARSRASLPTWLGCSCNKLLEHESLKPFQCKLLCLLVNAASVLVMQTRPTSTRLFSFCF